MEAFTLANINKDSKVFIFGKKSTGKTTLALHLADILGTKFGCNGAFIVNVDEDSKPEYSDISDDIYLEFDQEEFDTFCQTKNAYLLIDNCEPSQKYNSNGLTIVVYGETDIRKVSMPYDYAFITKDTKVADIRKTHSSLNLKYSFDSFKQTITHLNDSSYLVVDKKGSLFVYTIGSEKEIPEQVPQEIPEKVIAKEIPEQVIAKKIPEEVIAKEIPEQVIAKEIPEQVIPEPILESDVRSLEDILTGSELKRIISEINTARVDIIKSVSSALTVKPINVGDIEFQATVEKKRGSITKDLALIFNTYNVLLGKLDTELNTYSQAKVDYMNSL